ncbi:MAG: hypothetical protein EBZ18_03940 [Alphaproteobacteria bacterium]|nr:hypothetical protein [Alphaproteobacteria bacterium]
MTAASDRQKIARWLQSAPDTESVAGFIPGPGISKLDMTVDIGALNADLNAVLEKTPYHGDTFKVLPVNHRPGQRELSATDLSGRYYLRLKTGGDEVAMEEVVDEAAYTELDPVFNGTSFENLFHELKARFTLGRMRILSKTVYSCNSWHRDPEPRIHIPLVTNPGSLFIVNHHATHLPADGSVYFTDTRGYHTALNGGVEDRVHIVAAIATT